MKKPPDDDLKVSQPPWSSANAAPIYHDTIPRHIFPPGEVMKDRLYAQGSIMEGLAGFMPLPEGFMPLPGLRAKTRGLGRAPEPLNFQACPSSWRIRPRHILPVHDAEHTSGIHHTEPGLPDGARCKILRCGIPLTDPSHSGPSHSGPSRYSLPNRSSSECHPSQCWLSQGGLSRCRLPRCGTSHHCLSHYGLSNRQVSSCVLLHGAARTCVCEDL